MHKYSTLILSILLIVGTVLTLIQLYASSDNLQHPLSSSLYYLGTSIGMIFVLIKFRKDIGKKFVIMNNFVIGIFSINGIILALICLYTLEPQGRVDSLASSIFYFSGMLAGSSVFFVGTKRKNSIPQST